MPGNQVRRPDVPGRTHRKDTLIASGQERPFQKPPPLIVKEKFVPLVLHELGNDHDDVASGIFFESRERTER